MYSIVGPRGRGEMPCRARSRVTRGATTAAARSFTATVRIDTPAEAEYYRHGGILQYVLRQLAGR